MTQKQTNNPFLLAIAGGTGSGKTYVARELQKIAPDHIQIIQHDNYYKDRSDVSKERRKFLNYDYPGAFDNDLFHKHLKQLKEGKSIEMPRYSFKEHKRLDETTTVEPTPVILVEGILVLSNKKLRSLYDLILYLQVEGDIRLARRLKRDVGERDSSYSESLKQYLESAQPMHDLYVEPGEEHADIVINNNKGFAELDESLEVIKAEVRETLTEAGVKIPEQPVKSSFTNQLSPK